MSSLPGVCTHIRHMRERSGRNRAEPPAREAYVASELFFSEAWRRSPGIIKSSVCNYNSHKIHYIQSWTSVRFAEFDVLFLPEQE